jgi:alkylation response protein AidB-like acyl-CoA dehydrogenase
MNLLPTAEQEQIAAAAKRFLVAELPVERLRDGTVRDATRLPALAELGWLAICLDEAIGGTGGSLIEEQIVFREAGRVLVSPVLLATALAAKRAAHFDDLEIASQFAAASRGAAFAIPLGRLDLARPMGEFLLIDGDEASDWVLWSAEGMALVSDATWDRRAVRGLDNSLPHARARFVSGKLAALALGEDPLVSEAHLLNAALMLGASRAALDMILDYVKVREQFGRPIGSFQAVKHRCADCLVRSEAAQALIDFASVSIDGRRADAAFQARAARIVASKAGFANAAANIQLHGAMGFTAQCDAHWFQKRMHVLDQLGGSLRLQEAALLERPPA